MAEKETPENKKDDLGAEGKTAKKRKLILIAGIGGVLLLALLIGGFVVFKTMSPKKHAQDEALAEAAATAPAKAGEDGKSKDASASHDKKEEKKDEKKDSASKKDENKKNDGKKPEDAGKETSKGTANFGDSFVIPKMDLNLGNPIENRFLRIALAIEYRGGEEQLGELKKREVQIKDIIITTVTNKTRMQLLSENGKELLRREIMNKINEVTDKPVQNVFFTEFLLE